MNEARRRQVEAYRRMTPERKLAIVEGLRRAAWALHAAGLRRAHPDWDDRRLRTEARKVLLRART